jgi:hypothetical protein
MKESTMSKLKELLKAAMTNAEAVRLALAEPALAKSTQDADTDQAICLVNEAIIDALELPKSERTAAQVALAKACDRASQVALHTWGVCPNTPTKMTLAGAKGLTLGEALADLQAAASAAGVSLAMPDECESERGARGWKVPKRAPKPWHKAYALLLAASAKV